MTDRTVKVRLVASVAEFQAGLKRAAKSVDDLGHKVNDSSKKHSADFDRIGKGAALMGAGLLAGFGLAANAAKDFEKEMSGVKAVSGATAREMDRLTASALKAGKDTVFSASEAATAEAELAKAGVSTSEIIGGALTGSLSLAAAGQLDLADAATISAQAMNIFKLSGSDVGHIADVLAAGANKSAADVSQLGAAMRQSGLVAAQTGLDLEDTVGVLSAFADNALIGSDAGTSLKTMLQRLTPQSDEAAEEMSKLGISAYDAQGNFIGLEKFAGNLRASMGKLTPEQRNLSSAIIFGSDAVRASNVLYDLGAEGVREYTEAVDDHGAAARMAAVQMDNLDGDLEQLSGSIETALIKGGTKATGVLRGMTQATTGAVNAYIDMPGPVQTATTAIAGISGATLLAGGAALVIVPKIAKLDESMRALTNGAVGAKGALGGLAKAGAVVGVLAGITYAVVELEHALEDTPPSVDATTNALLDFAHDGKTAGALAKIVGQDFNDLAEKVKEANLNKWFSFTPGHSTTAIGNARKEIDSLDKALASLVTSGNADIAKSAFNEMANAMRLSGVSEKQIEASFGDYQGALDGVTVANKKAGVSIGGVAGEMQAESEATNAATDALKKHSDGVKALYDPVFAMRKALVGQKDAQTDLTKAVKEHGKGSKEAEDALFNLASANVDVTVSADGLKSQMVGNSAASAQMTGQLKLWVSQGLLTQAQADKLGVKITGLTTKADTLTKTPATVDVKTKGVPGALADLGKVEAAKRRVGQPVVVGIRVTGLETFLSTLTTAKTALDSFGTGGASKLPSAILPGVTAAKKADGGWISGDGGPRSDNIPILASPGEFVVNAPAAARNRGMLEQINAGTPRFADGGLVSYRSSARHVPGTGASGGGGQMRLHPDDLASLITAGRGFRDLVVQTENTQASASEIVEEAVFAARLGRF